MRANSLLQTAIPLAIHNFFIMNVSHAKNVFLHLAFLSKHYLMELSQKIPDTILFILFDRFKLFLNEEKQNLFNRSS